MGIFGWSYPPGAADDPNAPYNQSEDWDYECDRVRDALKEFDTGRWDWEKIDCTLTGKDADIEPWGDQGIEVSMCDDEHVDCVAHIMKTVAGSGVCLAKEYEIPFQVAWVMGDDGADYQKTARAIIDAAERELAPIVEELILMDQAIDEVAGYRKD